MAVDANLKISSSPKHPFLNDVAKRNWDALQTIDNNGVEMARHHTIPKNKLKEFWNSLIEREYNDHGSELRKLLCDLVKTVVANMAGYHMSQAVLKPIGAFVTKFCSATEFHQSDAEGTPVPNGFANLGRVYSWLPGNLFEGPSGKHRRDDPKEGFEVECEPIIGNEFGKRAETYLFIRAYLLSPTIFRQEAERALAALMALCSKASPTPLETSADALKWDKESDEPKYKYKYFIKPPSRPSSEAFTTSTVQSVHPIGSLEISPGKTLALGVTAEGDGYVREWGRAENISMTELVGWVRKNWPGCEIPEEVEKLTIDAIALEALSTQDTTELEFSVSSKLQIGSATVNWIVHFAYSKGPGGKNFSLAGEAGFNTVADGKPTRVWFTGSIAKNPAGNGWEFQATWSDSQGITFPQLATALGLSSGNLPGV
ncbi:hypothetical protein [Streptomyces sp. I05A-00742]|uniref:hypothetical protein n=1 Tax=Streptomyces sp. I05A-00742 TaxID=2732853 RepID=UPI001488F23B|nr:hypothetical protein [Streptomyces sp. I05A-00742]